MINFTLMMIERCVGIQSKKQAKKVKNNKEEAKKRSYDQSNTFGPQIVSKKAMQHKQSGYELGTK